MAKYSSDSDSERSSSKYRSRRKRSSSTDSSDSSSSYQRRSKYKGKRRYRSRSKSRERSGKSYRHSRDSSRDRKKYRSQKSRSPSEDRNRSKKRSGSREISTGRSSSQSNAKVFNIDKPGSTSKDNFFINDTKIKASVLDDINSDSFVPKQFVSSAKNKESKMKNIVIDINADTIRVPQIANTSDLNSIFHTSVMADKEARFDKWVKKLYSLRQKALNEMS